jgi:HAD superfamily hydrolase (TIGR01509 family)
LDGLLVDSAAVWETAFRHGAALLDGQLARWQLMELVGCSVESGSRRIAHWLGSAGRETEITECIIAALRVGVVEQPPRPLPGAHALLRALHGEVPVALASNGPAEVVEAMLAGAGLDKRFDELLTAADVSRPKPNPAVYQAACACLELNPANCVAVEDSAIGAAAAIAAGLETYLVGPDAAVAKSSLGHRAARKARTVGSLADFALWDRLLGTRPSADGESGSAASPGGQNNHRILASHNKAVKHRMEF